MSYAVLSDVHANIEALDAVLEDAGREAEIICAGDVVGYGPDPEACIERLRETNARCVAGNHDLAVLGRLQLDRFTDPGVRAIRWTRGALSSASTAWLSQLPLTQVVGDCVVSHAMPNDPEHYVSNPDRAAEAFRRARMTSQSGRIFICGHTHEPMLYMLGWPWVCPPAGVVCPLPAPRTVLLNPGSVGQARRGPLVARYLRLDEERGEVAFREVEYQHANHLAKLESLGFDRPLWARRLLRVAKLSKRQPPA